MQNIISNFKVHYKLGDWRLWYKLSFIIILTIVILIAYIHPMILGSTYANQINNLIDNNESINNIEDLLNFSNDEYKWIIINNKNGIKTISSLISFKTIILSGSNGIQELKLHANYNPFEKFVQTSSFFTMISNLVILVWMYIAFFKPQNEGLKGFVSVRGGIIAATYITVTFLIYQVILRAVMAVTTGMWFAGTLQGFENEVFHTVAPIMFVIYIMFGIKNVNKDQLTFIYLKKTWFNAISGLFGYGIYSIIKGLLKVASGTPSSSQEAFPYFFFQVTELNVLNTGIPGIVYFLIFMIIISGICFGFTTLYQKIILMRFNRIKNNLEIKISD